MAAVVEVGIDALCQRLSEGQSISGLPTPIWPEPTMELEKLPPPAKFPLLPFIPVLWPRRPKGPLRAHVGRRIDVKGHVEVARLLYTAPEAFDAVTAWPVLALTGATFEVESTAGIPVAMRKLLSETLPGLDWWVPTHWKNGFEKGGILHNTLPAPPNDATGEPMAIEIYGMADRCYGTKEHDEFCRAWQASGSPEETRPIGVLFPTSVTIFEATYANIRFPGVEVPSY